MIYVIEQGSNGPIKIGTAIKPEARLKSLQSGNPEQLNVIMTFPGGPELENQIHKDLAKYKTRDNGEWFQRKEEVFLYLQKFYEPKTEFLDGTEYIVLWRDTEESPIEFCPFCGKRHIHGREDGHRVAHCSFGEEAFSRKSDGKVFHQSQGYIVRTKK